MVNDAEARELSGVPNLVRAARHHPGDGPARRSSSRRASTARCSSAGDDIFAVPALPLADVIDPTGAGDTFLGGFAGHLLRIGAFDAPAMRQAVVVGSALASFVVEAFGTDALAGVSAADLEERLDVFRRLSAVPEGIAVGAAG